MSHLFKQILLKKGNHNKMVKKDTVVEVVEIVRIEENIEETEEIIEEDIEVDVAEEVVTERSQFKIKMGSRK